MTRKAKYIVFEGTEGCGKTTQAKKYAEYLRSKGLKVLETREPGTVHSPITMELRKFMLDMQYETQLTKLGRELISQSIRSIHMERVIMPALEEYDAIIQDRGILTGLAYGEACGNDYGFLFELAQKVVAPLGCLPQEVYSTIVYLHNDPVAGLARAKSTKQEFQAGDAMEARGNTFMQQVARNMDEAVKLFPHCTIEVQGKTIDEVFQEIASALN